MTPQGAPAGARARWRGALAGVLDLGGGLALAVLLAVTVGDAFLRSVLNRPIFGGGDLVQVALAGVVAAALPLSVLAGRAIAIEILTERLPRALIRPVARVVALAGAAACALVAWRCWVNVGEAAAFGETTMLLRLPFGPVYLALAVGFGICALGFLHDAVKPGAGR